MTRSPGLEEHPVIAPKLAVTVLRAPAEPARVVALMPGLGTAVSGTWDTTAEHLAADSHVIALDLPGHGRSPAWDAAGEAPSMEWLARATDATIEAELEEAGLNGLPLHFAGISLAGGLALQLALDHAGRFSSTAVICSAAAIGQPSAWTQRAEAVRSDGTASLAEGAASRWFAPRLPRR
ncbi:alpha/beta hydrolase [Nesterenkonia cremea]|uniref:alpha/beta hydrolase n=1 Tax=Nesterenkonia cremea TaxID=1882340 RepID=UPI00166F35E5|nr:alpha/beta fold hydrolase [Nesterenkonia cremea]